MPTGRGHETRPRLRPPQLGVSWESRREELLSSLRALVYGPVPPKGWPLGPYFRDSWVRSRIPGRTLLLSAVTHVLIFVWPVGLFMLGPRPVRQEEPRYQLTWYGRARDLPPLLPLNPPAGKKSSPRPRGEETKPLPRRGADAYHPRQIILSQPARPNHPRQTLIQPEAPPEPPKILPPLPNIVQWSEAAQPARPRLRLNPELLRPRRTAVSAVQDVAAPEVQNRERTPGPLNIASSALMNNNPKLPMQASAVPRVGPRSVGDEVAPAPDIGPAASATGNGSVSRLIALSATPAPPSPIMDVPLGNLAARISISPDGLQPGVPGGSSTGVAGGTGGSAAGGTPAGQGGNGGMRGPEGIVISGGDPNNRASMSGVGNGSGGGSGIGRPANPLRAAPLPERPAPRVATVPEMNPRATLPRAAAPEFEKYTPGAPPEIILGPKKIYTLNVNMPNLTSVTGSWILQFAELDEEGGKTARPGINLVGPVPLRKVDPKYPPLLRGARVEGEVVLYAIIRRDGSVDSIQLVKGLEPTLNQNAIEALSRWKFRPAERAGQPVELEAIVLIPFRAVAPL
jgi:protein TonB